MSGRYIAYNGWARKLMRTAQPREALYRKADEYKDAVSSSMPVRTGALAEDFDNAALLKKSSRGLPEVELDARGEFYPHIWHIIEYGSVKNPPYAPLRKGAERAGLEWHGGAG